VSGWQTVQLGDVTAKVGSGSTPRGGETAYKATGVPLIRSMNVHFDGFRKDGLAYLDDDQAAALRNVEVQAGDVLLNITGASIGRVTVAPQSMHGARVNQHVCIIRPDSRLSSSFLRWHLASPMQQRLINSIESGATRQALTKEKILGFDVPLPSLDEQKATVAEIEKQFSRLDEAVADLQRVKANLKRYKAAVLKSAVTGRLVPTEADLARREGRNYETGAQLLQRILESRRSQWQGKGKYKAPAAPDTTNLPELPEGWVWVTADQLSEFITKGTTPSADKLSEHTGEVQFLKVYNLTFDGVLNYQYKPAFVSRDTHDHELARSKVRPGDVLINIVGPPLGQVSVVPNAISEANINQAIARFRPIAPVGSLFLAMLLMSEDVMRWAIGRAKTTAGQANLTLELCRSLPIPLPPLPEQHRIVAEVDRLLSIAREAEAEVDANLKRAQGLRQAVLQAAFSSVPAGTQ
jgi:type I restriction enzyme, S subunit